MTRTPKTASSTSSGTTTRVLRSRSMNSEDTTKPMAPPACWSASVSPRCGRGIPLAMCTRPSTPKSSAAQPMICRPAGPLLSGLRRLRQATKHSSSGTNQPSRPTEPFTTVRVKSPTPPGSCHHTAAATTTASPIRNRPAPSRRCSGSSSRAVCPTLRTVAPSTWATPSQTAASPRPRASPSAAIGPVPFRTARGAGRLDFFVERPFAAGFLRDWLPDDRVVDPDPFGPALGVGLEVPFVRDAGGEDVRVAMLPNVHRRHTSPRLPTPDPLRLRLVLPPSTAGRDLGPCLVRPTRP